MGLKCRIGKALGLNIGSMGVLMDAALCNHYGLETGERFALNFIPNRIAPMPKP